MSHKTLYTCDGCDAKAETKPEGYPDGWALVRLEASGFIPFCRPAEIEGNHDLCAVCQDHLVSALKVLQWPRPDSVRGEPYNGE